MNRPQYREISAFNSNVNLLWKGCVMGKAALFHCGTDPGPSI